MHGLSHLSTRHHVSASQDNRDAILLHRSRLLVPRFGHILHQDGSQACPSEGLDGAWDVIAGGGHLDVIILVKVDATGDARGVELGSVAVSLGHVHLLRFTFFIGESVGALVIGAIPTHVTLFATLATAHWLRTVCNLVAFFPASPALGRLRAVGSLVTFLPAVEAFVRLGTVVPHMALDKSHVSVAQETTPM